ATAGDDGRAQVISVPDGREVTGVVHGNTVRAVAFSPDGKLLATAGVDGTARLVTVEGGGEVARVQPERAGRGVAFSPDGKLLATADVGGRVRVWSADPGDMLRRLCATPGRNLSRAEWQRDPSLGLSGLPWQATCEGWPTPTD